MEKLQQIKQRKKMLALVKSGKLKTKTEVIERRCKRKSKMLEEYHCK